MHSQVLMKRLIWVAGWNGENSVFRVNPAASLSRDCSHGSGGVWNTMSLCPEAWNNFPLVRFGKEEREHSRGNFQKQTTSPIWDNSTTTVDESTNGKDYFYCTTSSIQVLGALVHVIQLQFETKVRKSQKKARKSLDMLKAKLEVQKSRLSGAVEGFKAHSKRLVPAVIDPTEAADIFRNLHLMKQTELSAEAEIGVIEDEMAPVEHLIRQEQMIALQVERDLRKQTTICVSSRDEVRVLKNSGIGYGLSVVRSAKDRSALISFCKSLGFRTLDQ